MNNLTEEPVEGQCPPSILPPHYWLGSIVAMLCLRFLLPFYPLLSSRQLTYGFTFGLFTLAIGLWFAFRGSNQFTKVGTNIVPFTPASVLVCNGVFRYSRNPMYTGMVLGLVGVALMTNQLWCWLVVVAFTLVVRYRFIAYEELQMQDTFGDAYSQYKKNVRRWL